jgi:hypothetical protein
VIRLNNCGKNLPHKPASYPQDAAPQRQVVPDGGDSGKQGWPHSTSRRWQVLDKKGENTGLSTETAAALTSYY